jgi:hypothetical protein
MAFFPRIRPKVVAKRKNVRTELQQAIVGLNIIGKLYWMASAPRDYTEPA